MTFLNTLMLLGLAAVAIPLLIHLFHRQRVSTIDFSSVIFIRNHHLQRSRTLRLRELLLLLLRTLIILLLVLAFARPVVEGLAGALLGYGLKPRTVFAIVLDNSYSMAAGSHGDTPFNAAREEALRIVSGMRDGDEGMIILSAVPAEVLPEAPATRMETLRNLLADLQVSRRSGDVAAALALAREKLAGVVSANKQIYVLSDLQRNDWQGMGEAGTAAPPGNPRQVRLYSYSAEGVDNASIDAVSVSEGLLIRNQPEQFVATYTNRNDTVMRGRSIGLVINGEKRDSRQIAADPGETGTVQFNILIGDPGRYSGYVELDEDDIGADNRRYFTLAVPEAIEVTAIGAPESRYFIEQVLKPSGGLVTPVDLRTASADVLNSDLLEGGVLIVDGGVDLTPARISSLERYISTGGGVLMFLGSGLETGGTGNDFFARVFRSTIAGRKGLPDQKQTYLRLDQVDHEHPVFHFAGRAADGLSTGAARFFASHILDPAIGAQVMARFTDGSPAVLEGRYGSGRAMLVASDIHTAWSDLALRSVFVPFMHRSVRYLHPSVAVAGGSYIAGEPVVQPLTLAAPVDNLSLEMPSGRSEAVNTRIGRLGMTVEVEDTRQPGVYLLRDGAEVLQAFAVNPDSRESDLERLSPEEAASLLGEGVSVVVMNDGSPAGLPDNSPTVATDRYEIWKSLIVLALLLLMVEYWLSGSRRGEGSNEGPGNESTKDYESVDAKSGNGLVSRLKARAYAMSGNGLSGRVRERLGRYGKALGVVD